ncbi:hypothetical protein SKAU_G00255810 [Synaphobranchus kaupii]|uniref:Uncharacterized protein n=1 Tax=Synaphobranchus kaupii TaxID=118154 RepID=A0A9Q1IRE8_SYNKA|nr:hypothetical protein SKAU_G00255810 [Synaphobranchus kaupii]
MKRQEKGDLASVRDGFAGYISRLRLSLRREIMGCLPPRFLKTIMHLSDAQTTEKKRVSEGAADLSEGKAVPPRTALKRSGGPPHPRGSLSAPFVTAFSLLNTRGGVSVLPAVSRAGVPLHSSANVRQVSPVQRHCVAKRV